MTWQARHAGSRPASRLATIASANVGQQHRQVELREVGVVGRLVADRPQPEPREAAGRAMPPTRPIDAGLDQELREDRAARRAERAAHADLGRPAQELGEQQADRVDQAHQQEAEREPRSAAARRCGTTLLKSSHSITSRRRTLGGRSKRPAALLLAASSCTRKSLVRGGLRPARRARPRTGSTRRARRARCADRRRRSSQQFMLPLRCRA